MINLSHIKAVIFDLDNTLLNSDQLQNARENSLYEEVDTLLSEVKLFEPTQNIIQAIKSRNIPIGLVTNSPRWYVDKILRHFGLTGFSAIVTYNDLGPTGKKPDPMGILMACKKMLITDLSQVIYIGDHKDDINAAYSAGVIPVAPSWAKTKIPQMPALTMSSSKLIECLDEILETQTLAEAAANRVKLNQVARGYEFPIVPLDLDGDVISSSKYNVPIYTLGRYFSNKSKLTASLGAKHNLSIDISAKDSTENYTVPNYWNDIFEFAIPRLSKFALKDNIDFDIVTVIPSKPGKTPRLESMLQSLKSKLNSSATFVPDLFYFNPNSRSLKTLGAKANREHELNNNFHLNNKYASILANKNVLIIDDVITTGATIRRTFNLLQDYRCASIKGLVIAKTVGGIGEEKECSLCGRPMRAVKNKQGIRFWSCTGYYELSNPCENTEHIIVKDCPKCGQGLVKRQSQFGFFLCHPHDMPNPMNCDYTESI